MSLLRGSMVPGLAIWGMLSIKCGYGPFPKNRFAGFSERAVFLKDS